jgi:hypothetical protein
MLVRLCSRDTVGEWSFWLRRVGVRRSDAVLVSPCSEDELPLWLWPCREILFFAPLYIVPLRFALHYIELSFLPHITLALDDLPLAHMQ